MIYYFLFFNSSYSYDLTHTLQHNIATLLNPKYTPNSKGSWESWRYCSCDNSLTSSYSKEDDDDTNEPCNNVGLSQSLDPCENQEKENDRSELFHSCSSNLDKIDDYEAASSISNMKSQSSFGGYSENNRNGYSSYNTTQVYEKFLELIF